MCTWWKMAAWFEDLKAMQESSVSKNDSKRIFLARLRVVRKIAFTQKIPNVVAHHVFIILAFVSFFKGHHILVKPFTLLL